MHVLPERPDLDQLRRQARELLRSAADGDQMALNRLRVVSDRVTLSVAQLAIAREYCFASWAVLRAEVQRRRRLHPDPIPPRDPLEFDDRRSYGGAGAITIAAGTLRPSALVIGAEAVLDCWLTPSDRQAATPEPDLLSALRLLHSAQASEYADLTVVDDRGTHYALSRTGFRLRSSAVPEWVSLRIEPTPPRDRAWIELRNQHGDATRLLPSARRTARVSDAAPVTDSPAERELAQYAQFVVELHLNAASSGAPADFLREQRAAAIAMATRVRRSGELDTDLPDQLIRLCAALAGEYPIDDLPPAWSGVLNGVRSTDGQCRHLDLAATVPPLDGTVTRIDSLVAEPESWRVHLRVRPGWWTYREDGQQKWETLTVDAEDDRGGRYVTTRHGEIGRGDHSEVTLRFLPRIDPLARAITLTLRGTDEQVAVELDLS